MSAPTQLFIEFDTSQHYFTLEGTHADAFRKVALFDVVVNNADRKGRPLLARLRTARSG